MTTARPVKFARVKDLLPGAEPSERQERSEVLQVILLAERAQRALLEAGGGGGMTAAELAESMGIERRLVNNALQLLTSAAIIVSDHGKPAARYYAPNGGEGKDRR
jgi:L-aminopeptidase/D-esterase-like protein